MVRYWISAVVAFAAVCALHFTIALFPGSYILAGLVTMAVAMIYVGIGLSEGHLAIVGILTGLLVAFTHFHVVKANPTFVAVMWCAFVAALSAFIGNWYVTARLPPASMRPKS